MLNEIGQWIGTVLGTAMAFAVLALIERSWRWINAKLSEQHQKMLSEAAHKVLTLGFTRVIPLIQREGWNSERVREEVIKFGIDELKLKFPDAFNYVKNFSRTATVPMSTDGTRVWEPELLLRDVLTRALPAAATEAAASPITPPAPQPMAPEAIREAAAAAAAATTGAIQAAIGPAAVVINPNAGRTDLPSR